jgi:hypothetical protein
MAQGKAQKETIDRVMHEFKDGDLKIGKSDQTVTNPKQAIAIALHEAGASNRETPAKNRKNLRRTKANERAGKTAAQRQEQTKAALYEEAKRRDIAGRSSMSKAELQRALSA